MAEVTIFDEKLNKGMCETIDELAELREKDKKAREKHDEERKKNTKPGRFKLYESPYRDQIRKGKAYLEKVSKGTKTKLMDEIAKFMRRDKDCKTPKELKEMAKTEVATRTLVDPDLEDPE